MEGEEALRELRKIFSDLLNHSAKDPLQGIHPLEWRSPEGDSCLHYAAMRGDDLATKLLLELGADPNQQGDLGMTAMHYASAKGHTSVVDALLEAGADPTILDEFGRSACGPAGDA